ncbi:MAG: hypothetical protein ACU0CA_14530 [Paracoccaceae bacterium]
MYNLTDVAGAVWAIYDSQLDCWMWGRLLMALQDVGGFECVAAGLA